SQSLGSCPTVALRRTPVPPPCPVLIQVVRSPAEPSRLLLESSRDADDCRMQVRRARRARRAYSSCSVEAQVERLSGKVLHPDANVADSPRRPESEKPWCLGIDS